MSVATSGRGEGRQVHPVLLSGRPQHRQRALPRTIKTAPRLPISPPRGTAKTNAAIRERVHLSHGGRASTGARTFALLVLLNFSPKLRVMLMVQARLFLQRGGCSCRLFGDDLRQIKCVGGEWHRVRLVRIARTTREHRQLLVDQLKHQGRESLSVLSSSSARMRTREVGLHNSIIRSFHRRHSRYRSAAARLGGASVYRTQIQLGRSRKVCLISCNRLGACFGEFELSCKPVRHATLFRRSADRIRRCKPRGQLQHRRVGHTEMHRVQYAKQRARFRIPHTHITVCRRGNENPAAGQQLHVLDTATVACQLFHARGFVRYTATAGSILGGAP
mmetsp:Transcript_5003/g.12580  ORF Transcript_5003/g.12580 Transcript_5003/m.12580 type:complete len:333 (+) Transcript_5003:139-1137(+)